ncbi:GNAT family N-acetyltransferase [Veronia nyctiphanis]|uniref:GNAT family N-acetyltransferase n=1 Tax=Veronia nyctiphanis TaxID=1278244 RepID=UPI00137643AA|nr:GNAT family N-acetyltransferase [Veronia nyctiphanis]
MPTLHFKNAEICLLDLAIRGDRIVLFPVHDRYAETIFTEFNASITRYMIPKPADDISEIREFIDVAKTAMTLRTSVFCAVCCKQSHEFLGICAFEGQKSASTPELGLWIKKSAHGNRYGLEAMETLFNWAIDNIDFDFAVYPVDKANAPSSAIAEHLGGEIAYEKLAKSQSGFTLNEVVYHVPGL